MLSGLQGAGDWYILALLAWLLMGTQRFFYKVSAARGCNSAWTTFAFMATVTLLSAALFFSTGENPGEPGLLVLIALLNSLAFLAGTISHIEALKHLPAGVVYPLTRLSLVVVVLFSVLFFQDRLSPWQGLGITLALAVVLLLTRQPGAGSGPATASRRGLALVLVAILAGAAASISSKFAALHTGKLAFMAVSYCASTLFSLGLTGRLQPTEAGGRHREALLIGLAMGVLNFAGYYAFLRALELGPLSVIAALTSMHFVIAIALSVAVYRERLTRTRLLGILLTLASVLLMRL
ncbi:hypothetical protein DESUT3_03910 [Desulfuromonas versatilis]|uniref:EamA domain-containing protein n=1 Tax=Desulfuromonas versatilis TaxID=2802975 RepID=A0ABM8HSA4_9BACT|nr:DMT family transporter [Desulfuromonas versatilis]BCR03322.1 hypothetical protein DESUT3_03910 [Desulfuromonas versatilis]